MFSERFRREAILAGFTPEEWVANDFTGVGVLCADADEVVRLTRSTSDPLWLEPLPRGGFLVHPKSRVEQLAELVTA